MMGIITQIKTAKDNSTTYRAGLLQAKAYRILKHNTARVLSEFDVSTTEWALIGLLYDATEGMSSSALAHELGVEAPFVTQLVTRLKKHGFCTVREDVHDSRVKIVTLADKGRKFVEKTEVILRLDTKRLFKGISLKDLMTYLHVLKTITNNE